MCRHTQTLSNEHNSQTIFHRPSLPGNGSLTAPTQRLIMLLYQLVSYACIDNDKDWVGIGHLCTIHAWIVSATEHQTMCIKYTLCIRITCYKISWAMYQIYVWEENSIHKSLKPNSSLWSRSMLVHLCATQLKYSLYSIRYNINILHLFDMYGKKKCRYYRRLGKKCGIEFIRWYRMYMYMYIITSSFPGQWYENLMFA